VSILDRIDAGLWLPDEKPPFGWELDKSHPLAYGLIGAWLFNEAGGLISFDLSGNGNHALLKKNLWAINSGGAVLDCDATGTDNDVIFGSSSVFDNLGPFSVSTRFMARTHGTNYGKGLLIGKTDSPGSPSTGWIIRWRDNTYGLRFRIERSVSQIERRIPAASINLYHEYNFDATWDGELNADGMHMYLDGVETQYDVDSDGSGDITDDSGNDLTIFDGSSGADSIWDGTIGYLFLYNRVRTPEEIASRQSSQYQMFKPRIPERWLYAISGGVTLSVNDLAHAHALDTPTLTQAHTLTVTDAAHAHALDNITLSLSVELVVADLAHAHALDTPTLTQAHTLAIDDAAHAHALDHITLSLSVELVVADLAHAHALDAPTLTQAHVLTVADLAHAHALDNVVLTQAHVLTVADLAHVHALDQISLAQAEGLLTITFTEAAPDITFTEAAPDITFTEA